MYEYISDDLISIKHFPSENEIEYLASRLMKGNCIIIRNVLSKEYCLDIVNYLSSVRLGTIPAYEPLRNDSPNHYRINHLDKRASVKGYFEQFNFFMHNQDLMNIFGQTSHIFELKDNLSYIMDGRKTKYTSLEPPKNYISRIGFQFYPSGRGYLEKHSDYIGENQLVVPTIIMSKRGEDFDTGGFYFNRKDESAIDPEPYVEVGDVIIFNPSLNHGVSKIDAKYAYNWNSCKGRWMAFATTTKTT